MDLFEHATGKQPFMRRYFKPLLVLTALLLALMITVRRAGPHGHVDVGAGEPLRAAQKEDKRPYDLAALRIFNNTLMRINDTYVDPTRVDPKQMLLSALDQVQKSVAEVLVEPREKENKVIVSVDTARQEFGIGEVDSPWALSMKMKEIFRFIAQNLPPNTDTETVRNTEYAATNGMLSTLDPHSMLLDPTTYTEMKLNTRGSFGGLGILIGLRKGELTVIKPYPDTPASKAGIKAGDRIVRIDRESTVNMLINDAVSRLRGEPDTKVEVWVRHATEANSAAKKIVLTRAVVSTRTVDWKMLKGNVGFIKLHTNFAGNSDDELRKALTDLKEKGMKALVFDLRQNPGGLLDQAIKVTDEFVDTGTIVTTVGYANKQRDEKRATPGTQPHIPMAVLVNHGSASASEIVAGALKNLDRAVIIGLRTFGKGSVQVLYDNDDGSALKLTIAQYLTPGDVSIQSVGITPDVVLDKVVVDKDKGVWLFRDYKGMTEADLESHLQSKYAKSGDKPFETVKYLAQEPPKKLAKASTERVLRDENKDEEEPSIDQDEEDENPTDPDAIVEDFEVDFARDLLASAKGWKRREVLASSKPFFDKKLAEEQARIVEALKKIGVDWTPVGGGAAPSLVGSVTTDKPMNAVAAGETIKFTAKVTNKGPGIAGQVRATLKGDDPFFEGREFVFGRIKPGETRTFTIPVKLPKDALSRIDPLRLEVSEEHGAKTQLDTSEMLVKVDGPQRPLFSYSYQVIDDVKGNGDGLVQRGESVRLHVTVKNSGTGKAFDTLAQLRNLSDEGVFINKGRFDLNAIGAGETKSIDFTFDVRPEYKPDTAKVELTVYDQTLHEYVTDKLSFPIAADKKVDAATGLVTVNAAGTPIHGGADKDAPVLGTADKGAAFKLTGAVGDYWRVELDGRPGYVAKTQGARSDGAVPAKVAWAQQMQVSPPRLDLKASSSVVDTSSIHISGTARDEHKVADVFVFVSNRGAKIDRRKVFYRSNRKSKDQATQTFDADIPLWAGANVVTVVARESTQVQSQSTIVVQRREPRVAQQQTHAKPQTPLEPGKHPAEVTPDPGKHPTSSQ
ncbi:MAG: Carboxyl-terminal protease [Myxococcales bacterium]|nr:Carboxyl-terminal protease [Myxococcales bacterium]